VEKTWVLGTNRLKEQWRCILRGGGGNIQKTVAFGHNGGLVGSPLTRCILCLPYPSKPDFIMVKCHSILYFNRLFIFLNKPMEKYNLLKLVEIVS
jgi:hypothetical protein